jgi:tetratricopeptide (TPR) repeat protein
MRFIRKFFILVFLLFLFLCCSDVWAVDWIALHEQAGEISLEQALNDREENPLSFEALYRLGLVYLDHYRTQEAQDVFLSILDKGPDRLEAQWGFAETLRRQRQYEESQRLLSQVIDQDPNFSPAYITWAYIKYIQFDFNGSLRLTGKVINQGQRHVDTTNFLRAHGLYAAAKGMIAHYGGPISKAINGAAVLKHLHIIQRLAPDSPVVNFGLGSYYMLIPVIFGQDLDKAKQYLEKTIEEDPLFADPYVRLAQIYKKRGDEDQYQAFLQKALALDPGNELVLDIKTRRCRFICLTQGE